MDTLGIIAEYNPFHTGHAHQLARTRALLGADCPAVAVMSGCWVQRGDPALADKWARARLALMGGADLVLELPTVWAAASAEHFARGAAGILAASGIITHLSFGSECGELAPLDQIAACLDSRDYPVKLSQLLDRGLPFAACRQAAVRELLGEDLAGLLSFPNNNLGIEYLRALRALGSLIRPMTVPRTGASHDSLSPLGPEAAPEFLSASQLRGLILDRKWDRAAPWLLPGSRECLSPGLISAPGLAGVERGILARLRTMAAEDWALLPDSGESEGLPRRLERAGHSCLSLEDFFARAKTRRFPLARLRRLVLWAWLGLTQADRPERPPYLRVLGFTPRGQALLREMRARAALPILTKPAHAHHLPEPARRLFALEARCTDLYDLCADPLPSPGRDWRTSPVRWDASRESKNNSAPL